jgi:hypothetical protein
MDLIIYLVYIIAAYIVIGEPIDYLLFGEK